MWNMSAYKMLLLSEPDLGLLFLHILYLLMDTTFKKIPCGGHLVQVFFLQELIEQNKIRLLSKLGENFSRQTTR